MDTLYRMWTIIVNLFQSPLILSIAAVAVLVGVGVVCFSEGRDFEREFGKDR